MRRTGHANTDADRLEVLLTLRQDYRQDLVDFHGRSFARFGVAPGLGDRVRFDDGIVWLDDTYGYYRQSFLSPPVSLPGHHEITSYPYVGSSSPLLPWNVESYRTSVIRWPVYLKDLAWYLFELPEGEELEAGEAWPTADDTLQAPSEFSWRYNHDLWDWTASSAYGVNEPRAHYPQCRPYADRPSEAECEAPSNQTGDKYRQSGAERVFFPFHVAGGLVADPGLLKAEWLRKAGVAGPTDGEAEGYARNNEFQFQVVEGDRYSEFAQDNEGAAALSLARIGQPPAGYYERNDKNNPTTEQL